MPDPSRNGHQIPKISPTYLKILEHIDENGPKTNAELGFLGLVPTDEDEDGNVRVSAHIVNRAQKEYLIVPARDADGKIATLKTGQRGRPAPYYTLGLTGRIALLEARGEPVDSDLRLRARRERAALKKQRDRATEKWRRGREMRAAVQAEAEEQGAKERRRQEREAKKAEQAAVA